MARLKNTLTHQFVVDDSLVPVFVVAERMRYDRIAACMCVRVCVYLLLSHR